MKIFEKVNNFKKPVMTAFSKIKKIPKQSSPIAEINEF